MIQREKVNSSLPQGVSSAESEETRSGAVTFPPHPIECVNAGRVAIRMKFRRSGRKGNQRRKRLPRRNS